MSQTRPAAPDPAEIAGRYQVLQKLGAGAFGTVYKAKDKILGRVVAIKTIRLDGLAAAGTSVEELVDRFKREARISAQLKHPNIVTIYDIGEADGVSYLAMEFIDGVGLDRIIAQTGKLRVDRAALIAGQIADALDFAHKNSVVHRDIKPANIMIETGDRVKVTDFGIAKVTNAGEHLTMTGSLLGTPSYMSPEQARGLELDGRSDLFAVGCLIYEMVSGGKAFRGDSITGLIFKIITEQPPPLEEIDPTLPPEILGIVDRALSKSPETRYQTGRQLADDLVALTRPGATPTLRQAEVPTAPGMPPVPPAGPAAATAVHPATMRAAPTVGMATPAGSDSAAAPKRVAPPPPPHPAPPPFAAGPRATPAAPARSRAGVGLLLGLALAAVVVLAAVVGGAWFLFIRKPPPGPEEARIEASRRAEAEGSLSGGIERPGADTSGSTNASGSPPPGGDAGTSGVGTSADAGTRTPADASPGRATTGAGTGSSGGGTGAASTGTRGRDAGAIRDTGTSESAGSLAEATRPPRLTDPPAPPAEASLLDQEPPAIDGTEAGQRVAESFRSPYGNRTSGFGASGRLRPRDRVPRDLAPAERPAVTMLLWVMRAQELYYKQNERYGSYSDLVGARLLPLDVAAQTRSFVRRGYRFDLTVEGNGFQVLASPLSPTSRPFVGDDSGFVRAGTE